MNIQTSKLCHSMDRNINYLYFQADIIEKPYGYYFFSRFSKTKDKHVVTQPEKLDSVVGEIIQINKFTNSSPSVEVIYNLNDIFNEEHYANRKKFKTRILHPLKIASENGLVSQLATRDDFDDINKLHSEWVDKKLSDPRVHKITFSVKRYINCVNNALERPNCFVYIIRDKAGEIVNCRVITKGDAVLFGAANFTAFWNQSHISEACNLTTLKLIQENHKDAPIFNTGLASGSLKKYKQQFPNFELKVFRSVVKYESPTLEDMF